MALDTIHYTQQMSDSERLMFQTQIEANRKDPVLAVLLAFFFGSFGIHRFYLRQTGWGIIYLVFCWTGIPGVVAIIECFFLPGRVRRFNEEQMEEAFRRIKGLAPRSTVEAL
jgi:hypothetical protein